MNEDEIGGRLVTTVFDLLLAQYGVYRGGLPGDWPFSYDDASQPRTRPGAGDHLGAGPADRADRQGIRPARCRKAGPCPS